MVDMIDIDSSSIASIGFESHNHRLHVRFWKSNDVYVYLNVSDEEFRDFLSSDSKGAYLNSAIKPHHPYVVRKN